MYLSWLFLKPGSLFFKAHIHKSKKIQGWGWGEMTTSQVPRQKTRRVNGSWLRTHVKAKTRNQSTRNLRTETTHMCKSGKEKRRSWDSTGPPSAAPRTADSPQKQGTTRRTRQSANWEFSFVFWGWLSMNCWMTGKLRCICKLQEQMPGGLTGARFTRHWCSGIGNNLNTFLAAISGERRVSYKRMKRFIVEV